MNHVYKVVYCKSTGTFVAVDEFARAQGKKGSSVKSARGVAPALGLAAGAVVSGALLAAGAPALAQVSTSYWGVNTASTTGTGNQNGAGATGAGALAGGHNAAANGESAAALGRNANAFGNAAVALGHNAVAAGHNTVSVGSHAGLNATGANNIAIGVNAGRFTAPTSIGSGNVALGQAAKASGGAAVAISRDANAVGAAAMAFGENSLSSGSSSIAFGARAVTQADTSLAIGPGANVVSSVDLWTYSGGGSAPPVLTSYATSSAVAIGQGATAGGKSGIAIGNTAQSYKEAVAIGPQAYAEQSSAAIGANALANKESTVALGNSANATHLNATAVGAFSRATGYQSMALGNGAIALHQQATALGVTAQATEIGALALGPMAQTFALYGAALGTGSVVNTDYAVALGARSNATGLPVGAAGFAPVGITTADSQAIADTASNIAGISVGGPGHDTPWKDTPAGAELRRQIHFVAAGTQDTDAVNVAQLKAVASLAQGAAANAAAGAVHYYSINSTDNNPGTNHANDGATGTDAMAAGFKTVAGGNQATAVGTQANAFGHNSVALGINAGTGGEGLTNRGRIGDSAVAVGHSAQAIADRSIAMGRGAVAGNLEDVYNHTLPPLDAPATDTIAIGTNARATQLNSTAVGYEANAHGVSSIAMGWDSQAVGHYAMAIGGQSTGYGSGEIRTEARGDSSMAIGYGALVRDGGKWSMAIGDLSEVGQGAITATAFGREAQAFGVDAMALGYATRVHSVEALALGSRANVAANALGAMAMGADAAVGAGAAGAVALGEGAGVSAGNNGGVALGAAAVADRVAIDATAVAASATAAASANQVYAPAPVLGAPTTAEAQAVLDTVKGTAGAVSLGNANITRQITNLAAGSEDSDAVNVAQLKAVASAASQPMTFSGDRGGDVSRSLGQTLEIQGGAASTAALTDGNIGVVANGTDTLKVQLAKDLTGLGSTQYVNNAGNNTIKIDGNAGTITGLTGSLPATQNGAPGTATTGQAAPVSPAVGNAATVGDVLNAGWNLQTNGAATDFVRAYDTVNFENGTGTTVQTAVSADGATTSVKVNVNAQSVAEAAQLPVVYTDASGNKLYKHTDGNFYTQPNGTGTQVAAADVIASMNSGAGDTATPTKLTNVAPGTISGTSTDAINGSQLHAATGNVANALGGGATVDGNGNLTAPSYSVTKPGVTPATGTHSNVGSAIAALSDAVNTPMTFEGNSGSTERTLGQTLAVTGADGNITTTASAAGLSVKLNPELTGLRSTQYVNNAGGNTIKIDGNAGTITGLTGSLPATQNGAPGTATTGQAAPVSPAVGNAATVGDVLNAGWNLQTNGAATDFVRAYDTVNFENGTGTTVQTAVSADGATTSVKVNVNAQSLAETAQLPVVYTDANGNKLYKHTDGNFYTQPNGTGTQVAAADVIASMNSGAGSTTDATTLANVKAGVNDTDAVNVSQLKGAAAALGGGAAVNPDGTFKAPSYTITKTDGTAYAPANNVGDALGNLNAEVVKPITFAGDSGSTTRSLGSTLTIAGDSNITTAASAGRVDVKLNPNLNVTSVNAGGTVIDSNGLSFTAGGPTVSANGINAGGRQVTGVASGLGTTPLAAATGATLQNAVNVGDLQNAIGAVNADVASKTFGLTADSGPAATSALNGTLQVAGDGANISTRTTADGVRVSLNDSISVTNVTASNTVGVTGGPTMSTTGLNMGGKQVSNMASGLNGRNLGDVQNTDVEWNNGATIGDLRQVQLTATGTSSVVGGNTVGGVVTGPDGVTPINNNQGTRLTVTQALTTYDVSGQTATNDNSVLSAIYRMNNGGIKYFHTNDGSGQKTGGAVSQTGDSSASGRWATAIGADASATAENAIALGHGAQATGISSISIGTGNVVRGDRSGAIGDPTYINADNAYAIGNNNRIDANQAFVLGNNVTVGAGNDGAVVLGHGSTVGPVHTGHYTLGGVHDSQVAGRTGAGTQVVSVGAAGAERQIQNVAPGVVSPTSTDAINGSQLYLSQQAMGKRLDDVAQDGRAGTAAAMAVAGLPQAYLPGKSMAAAAISGYRGQSALAVGVTSTSDNGKWILKGALTHDSRGSTGVTVGAGFQW